MSKHPLIAAFETNNIEDFLALSFPYEWNGIAARILETGATFSFPKNCCWAPRWSKIPLTVRYGSNELETAAKSVIFRVHDCLHQLWGLPHPISYSNDEFYYFKRSQMCGEVAVLTLTEFVYVKHLYLKYPELRGLINSRNAIPLLYGPLAGKTVEQIAMRMDDILHKKTRPSWVRDNAIATKFVEDYVPMLENDRQQINQNWSAMKAISWDPSKAPKAKFGRELDGLELTIWMIKDFEHLLSSSDDIDYALMDFNRQRRANIQLPTGWVS